MIAVMHCVRTYFELHVLSIDTQIETAFPILPIATSDKLKEPQHRYYLIVKHNLHLLKNQRTGVKNLHYLKQN